MLPTEWVTERLVFFFEESADASLRKALVGWAKTAAYLTGVTAGGGGTSTSAAWAQARADKVALVRALDEQQQRLEQTSLALALAPPELSGSLPPGLAEPPPASPEASAARQVSGLRRELGDALERVRALEQENATVVHQLSSAQAAARRMAAEAERLATPRSGRDAAARPMDGEAAGVAPAADDFAIRYAAAANALSEELSQAHHSALTRTLFSGKGIVGLSEVAGGGETEAVDVDVDALERQRAELETRRAEQQEAYELAARAASAAEEELTSLQRQADRSGQVGLQRQLDEASEAMADAEEAGEQFSAQLDQLYPMLDEAQAQRAALRSRTEALLPNLRPREVSSLPEARMLIELLQEQLSETERRARQQGRQPTDEGRANGQPSPPQPGGRQQSEGEGERGGESDDWF